MRPTELVTSRSGFFIFTEIQTYKCGPTPTLVEIIHLIGKVAYTFPKGKTYIGTFDTAEDAAEAIEEQLRTMGLSSDEPFTVPKDRIGSFRRGIIHRQWGTRR